MWRTLLIKFGLWLARVSSQTDAKQVELWHVYLPSLKPETFARVRELITHVEHDPLRVNGETKRHCVYSALQQEFPVIPARELSFAIELALFTPSSTTFS